MLRTTTRLTCRDGLQYAQEDSFCPLRLEAKDIGFSVREQGFESPRGYWTQGAASRRTASLSFAIAKWLAAGAFGASSSSSSHRVAPHRTLSCCDCWGICWGSAVVFSVPVAFIPSRFGALGIRFAIDSTAATSSCRRTWAYRFRAKVNRRWSFSFQPVGIELRVAERKSQTCGLVFEVSNVAFGPLHRLTQQIAG